MAHSPISRHECRKRSWGKTKSNPEFHERHKKYQRKYYKKNKDKYSVWQKTYKKEMSKIAREIGNCPICFKLRDNPKYKNCSKCRKYHREWKRRTNH